MSRNYLSHSHGDLYDMVHPNVDPGQADAHGQAWHQIGDTMLAIGRTLGSAATATENAWTGDAADAARGFHTGLASWAGRTGESARLVSDNMRAMPKPVPYSFTDELRHFRDAPNPVAGMNAMNRKLATQQQAHQAAANAVQSYDRALSRSAGTMPPVPTFNPNTSPAGYHVGGFGPGGSPTPNGDHRTAIRPEPTAEPDAGQRRRRRPEQQSKRPSFLVEADQDSLFGTDERTVPPVIG